MKKNMGSRDKLIRITLGMAMVILFFGGFVTGTAGYILLVFAGIFVVTSFIGVCPLYKLFRINTRSKTDAP